MAATTPPGTRFWGLTRTWLLIAGAAFVLTAVITTFGLRLLNPEPTVQVSTIEPSSLLTPLPQTPTDVFTGVVVIPTITLLLTPTD